MHGSASDRTIIGARFAVAASPGPGRPANITRVTSVVTLTIPRTGTDCVTPTPPTGGLPPQRGISCRAPRVRRGETSGAWKR